MTGGRPWPIGADVDHFVRRLLTDCVNEATSRYWLKRAEDFENARPRIGDFHGKETPEEIEQHRAKWRELTEIANACRARAQVSPLEVIDPDVEQVWGESA